MDMDSVRALLPRCVKRSPTCWSVFDLGQPRKRAEELRQASMASDLWGDPDNAQAVMQQLSMVETEIARWRALDIRVDELLELNELAAAADEQEMLAEIETEAAQLRRRLPRCVGAAHVGAL